MNDTITMNNVRVSQIGNSIMCSNGKTYNLIGRDLFLGASLVSRGVSGVSEAYNIVIGLEGGKMF